MGPTSDICPDGRDDLCWRAQVWAVPGGFEEHDLAARDAASHELSDLLRGNDILAALKDQGWNCDLGEITSVVRCEGDARECLCDLRIGPTKAVGQFLAELRMVRVAHDGRRHRRGPTHMIVFEELEKLRDLLFGEAADI